MPSAQGRARPLRTRIIRGRQGSRRRCHEALGHDAELSRLRAETPDEAGGSPVGRTDERGGGHAADVPAGRDGTSSVLTVIT